MKLDILAKTAKQALGLARNSLGPIGMKIVRHSPTILTVTGIAGIVGGTAMMCRAYSKSEAIVEWHELASRSADSLMEKGSISEAEHDQQIREAKIDTVKGVCKAFAPAVAVEGAGILCMLGANRILSKRTAAAVAAALAADAKLRTYRENVEKSLGESKAKDILYGAETVEKEETKLLKNGSEKTVKKKVSVVTPDGMSPYAQRFDKVMSREHTGSYEYDMQYILEVERHFNHMLQHSGRVFLNDVYKKLGLVEEDGSPVYLPEGQMVGWLKDGDGDGFVEIRMFEYDDEGNGIFRPDSDAAVKYKGFWLDFNVDGMIFDKA